MDNEDKSKQKVKDIVNWLKLRKEKEALRQLKEERFRSAMGMRLKTPKKPDSQA